MIDDDLCEAGDLATCEIASMCTRCKRKRPRIAVAIRTLTSFSIAFVCKLCAAHMQKMIERANATKVKAS